jgi:hypothetical protein
MGYVLTGVQEVVPLAPRVGYQVPVLGHGSARQHPVTSLVCFHGTPDSGSSVQCQPQDNGIHLHQKGSPPVCSTRLVHAS